MSREAPPLVVCEYFSAGGRLAGEDPGPLRREGAAMLLALLRDLVELGLPDLTAVVRPDLGPRLPDGVEPAPGGADPAAAAARALSDRGDAWLWPIAPETRGELSRLAAHGAEAGAGVIGPRPRRVGAAARRLPLLRRLARHGIPVPATAPVRDDDEARRAARSRGWPVVVKPGRGAGGAGITRVGEPAGLPEALAAASRVEPDLPPLVQRFVSGTPASATLLVGPTGVRPLALNRQRVRFDPRARYRGGATPLQHPDSGRALRTAAAAADACGGLRGLVGVDLALGPDGPVVLEINPRLVTSYLGLRAHLGWAPAAAALAGSGYPARDRLTEHRLPVTAEPVRFRADRPPPKAPPPRSLREGGSGASGVSGSRR